MFNKLESTFELRYIYEDEGGNMDRSKGLVESVSEKLKDYMVTLEEHRDMFVTEDEKNIYGLVPECVEHLWNTSEGRDSSVRQYIGRGCLS